MWPAAADLKIWALLFAVGSAGHLKTPGLLNTTEKVESKWPKVYCQCLRARPR
jgi:hypothetical protein